MIVAELKGKVPSSLIEYEDILTSNVFSFFNYASRTTYLKTLLSVHSIYPKDHELRNAEFRFWPRYDDFTEPDVVIIVGNYYLLIEAKLHSDFGTDQIEREIKSGMSEAQSLNKRFIFIAITDHYNKPKIELNEFCRGHESLIRWMNWQAIAGILLDLLEKDSIIPDKSFTEDVYKMLDKMKLRSFLSFRRIKVEFVVPPENIFFLANSANFRGDFIGFEKALGSGEDIPLPLKWLFYKRQYFRGLERNLDMNFDFSLGGRRL